MSDPLVLKTCRLCGVRLTNAEGRFGATRSLFGGKKKTNKLVCERFADIGVSLVDHPDLSARICEPCFNALNKVESASETLQKWQSFLQHQAHTDGETREKRTLDTPSKTPRSSKKRRSVVSPNQTTPTTKPTISCSNTTEVCYFTMLLYLFNNMNKL